MSPDHSPSHNEFQESPLWEKALQNVSFSWTDPDFPLRRNDFGPDDAEELLNRYGVIYSTFEYILSDAPDLAEASMKCLAMIERTASDSPEVRDSVKLWFHLALIEEILVQDFNEQFDLFNEEVDERYYLPFAEAAEEALDKALKIDVDETLSKSEKSTAIHSIIESVGDIAARTMDGIEGFRSLTLREHPERFQASIDRTRLYSPSLSQEELSDFSAALEPQRGAIFMAEIDRKTREYRTNIQRTADAFKTIFEKQ